MACLLSAVLCLAILGLVRGAIVFDDITKNFPKFTRNIIATNLDTYFEGLTNVTILAPTDDAYTALGYNVSDFVLQGHVLFGVYSYSDIQTKIASKNLTAFPSGSDFPALIYYTLSGSVYVSSQFYNLSQNAKLLQSSLNIYDGVGGFSIIAIDHIIIPPGGAPHASATIVIPSSPPSTSTTPPTVIVGPSKSSVSLSAYLKSKNYTRAAILLSTTGIGNIIVKLKGWTFLAPPDSALMNYSLSPNATNLMEIQSLFKYHLINAYLKWGDVVSLKTFTGYPTGTQYPLYGLGYKGVAYFYTANSQKSFSVYITSQGKNVYLDSKLSVQGINTVLPAPTRSTPYASPPPPPPVMPSPPPVIASPPPPITREQAVSTVLYNKGCSIFLGLIQSTGLLSQILASSAITLLVPTDSVVNASRITDYTVLTLAAKYHSLTVYTSFSLLQRITTVTSYSTLAGSPIYTKATTQFSVTGLPSFSNSAAFTQVIYSVGQLGDIYLDGKLSIQVVGGIITPTGVLYSRLPV
eukprot:TRINITY_DN1437_c0_g2_i1.p1 TRINITY_DN1437_c0_g2~~TRINITY_DN1437_c0_g2_i1.p1  ORF type:complete len:530 (-),score=10.64 TRINITY_DN1437_c0_g2_i1:212-1777(-)